MKLTLSRHLPITALVGALASVGCKKSAPPSEGSSSAPAAQTSGGESETSKPPAASAESGGYQGLDSVADGGKITGTVSYAGKEADSKIKVSKDKEVCCVGCTGDEKPANALLAKGGKLSNAIVYLDGITKGKKLDPKPVSIDNKGCMFDPHVAIGYSGSDVVVTNSDSVLHNTHLVAQEGSKDLFNIALPKQGQTITKKLKRPGVIAVSCDAHDWMHAYIFSATHPYVAVTGADGAFSFTDVPAGKYTLKVWHERLGKKETAVEVAAKGEAKADVSFE